MSLPPFKQTMNDHLADALRSVTEVQRLSKDAADALGIGDAAYAKACKDLILIRKLLADAINARGGQQPSIMVKKAP